MRAPKKVIAAMAMATLIGGTVAPAFADDFTETTGPINGQPSKQAFFNVLEKESVSGDITVNGEFIKNVSSLPPELEDETEDGDYLCITMPLTLNYKYDINKKLLTSQQSVIRNESVSVTAPVRDGEKAKIEEQPVSMSFVKMEDTNNSKIKYVKETNGDEKVQLPFELVVTTNGQLMRNIPLADLVDAEVVKNMKDIVISEGNNVELEIAPIAGQEVKNGDSIENGETISNNLTLKFEYIGK